MISVAAGYLPILLFLAVALTLSTAFVVLPMVASRFTGSHNRPSPSSANMSAASRHSRTAARSSTCASTSIAILFIIFDLEAAFLYPWAVSPRRDRLRRAGRR